MVYVCLCFTTALSPNVDSYVFVKIVNDVAQIVIEEDAGDTGYDEQILLVFKQFVCRFLMFTESTKRTLSATDTK